MRDVFPIAAALLLLPAAGNAVDSLEFRVPVEVSNIENLHQVRMDCLVSKSPLRTEIDDEVDYSEAATIRDSSTVTLEDATGSWRDVMTLELRDGANGGIRLEQGRHYVCKLRVGYLKTGDPGDGVSQLADGNCDHEVQFIDGYRESMNADIAEHVLCRQGPLEPGAKVIELGSMYLRGGTATPDEMIANLTSLTTIEPRSKRVGPRYASFPLEGADIEECALACVRDHECRSWSGWESRGGRCFLSSTAPPAMPADFSFAYSGQIGAAEATVEPEPAAPGAPLEESPVTDVTGAIAAAMKASADGEPCRGAEILRPFLDDPQARSMHRKLQASCE